MLGFLRSVVHNVVHNMKLALSPEVLDDNTLNPLLLAVGTRGHWIQSHVFHIPDTHGFFSPGPARLQVDEAVTFLCLLFVFCFIAPVVLLLHVGLTLSDGYRPFWKDALVMFAPYGMCCAAIWIIQCYGRERAQSYVWEDWKPKTD